MKWQQAYPSRYLRGEQLGQETEVTIEHVELEDVTNPNGDTETKLVATFVEPVYANGPQRLVINKGNGAALAHLADSDETDAWRGLTVTLTPGEWNGRPTVRIKS
jgi:hypothetical protein